MTKTVDIEAMYQHLEDTVRSYNPSANFQQIRQAYEFARDLHGPQLRKDGSPFITHPLAVAQIVAEELHLDSESIEAALLHDTIEDTDATHEQLAKLFSPTVADLVEGVSKLTRVHYTSKEEEQMENLRKMLMAMSKDIRVILIKISDRLHNMRTMEYQTPEKQKQKSFETMEIYAPIAHRLGMQKMKWELEDLSLKYLDPVGYREITEALDEKAAEYDGFMSAIHDQIVTRLRAEGIEATVYGRMKHPYSIYRKMYTQNKSLDDVFDLFAFRVIVDTVADCYNVLGIIHDLYKPILGRFKDYIGTPKPNLYQSLHTTVVGESGIPFEVQIRTKEMHEVAEYGIAAHWKYKQNGQGGGDEGRYEWVRRLLENQEGADAEDFIHSLKVDMFADEVFVFTPNGDVINLPAGATPIDFAYTIHSAIGNHMTGAKVNGKIVPITYKLKTGEICEVLTSNQPGKGPSRDWLKVVTTGEARSKIRSWFKKEKRDENIIQGKAEVERELKRNFIRLENDDYIKFVAKIAERQHFTDVDDFYAAVGYGGIQITRLMPGIKDEYNRNWKVQKEENKTPLASSNTVDKPRTSKDSSGVVVDGIDNCLIKMARCCSPIPGEEIIGFINRGTGLTIHRRDCVNVPEDLKNCPEPERWVGAHWDGNVKVDARSTIDVYAIDRDGMVLDITTCLANSHVKIHSINARPINDGNCLTTMTITVNSKEHLDSIEKSIRKIEGVYHIERSAI